MCRSNFWIYVYLPPHTHTCTVLLPMVLLLIVLLLLFLYLSPCFMVFGLLYRFVWIVITLWLVWICRDCILKQFAIRSMKWSEHDAHTVYEMKLMSLVNAGLVHICRRWKMANCFRYSTIEIAVKHFKHSKMLLLRKCYLFGFTVVCGCVFCICRNVGCLCSSW